MDQEILKSYSRLNDLNVSRETFLDFENYISMILEKNKKINIISQNTASKKYTYALKTMADYKAKILENQFSGLFLTINSLTSLALLLGLGKAPILWASSQTIASQPFTSIL